MPSTYVKLASTTVGAGGAASIDFTSIPQTYTDLCLVVSLRSVRANTWDLGLVKFNNSSTNFSARYLAGDGSSAYSSTFAQYIGDVNAANSTSNTFNNLQLYIPNYTGSNNKSYSSDAVSENNATQGLSNLVTGLWSNTAAINQVTVYAQNANLAQYSTATLYGVLKYAETGTGSKAIGGTVTTSGGYTYHTFFSSGMFTPTTNISGAEVLVVAGGGAGGSGVPGGGGAGGLVYASSQSYTSGVNYAAIVGAGGAKSTGFNIAASNGTNSVFAAGTVAIGGGAGGGYTLNASNGGSGGGGSANGYAAGTGTAGQGNNGGSSGSSYGGGGGGAGAVGGTGGANSRGGDGGDGVSTYSAWGAATGTGQNVSSTYWYAGGGGGTAWNGVSATNIGGLGGKGGGGNGSVVQAANGLPFSGGGGGGGDSGSTNGGSGIVIVRYTT